ncbi:D-ribose pyranase [Pragia fontium]|uniref:D-ribose pyranase n=2 Tax=Pragia fontium TaxID=82985 RepID=A0AAJ5BIR9_9GAMM|nr:D-ribose pyranase [Pragia fontium]AKJ43397.1 D-ribose pyranase [Pragia fontium]SFD47605.1 D-ribose pyranase [Pragia fontium DSM 5563 = ATCC 49100]SUB83871.1 D-ribose pyranase [Pragia fontium]VEJ56776.1 D-ribose pyranase [Pragia fontium]GKX64416.1 D-ribose pyranase [Pragia fontium]
MKKGTLLNSMLSSVISRLGHTDTLVIGDAGLPIPASVERIDLAVTHGVPSFLQVLDVVTDEMQVEKAILANEIKDKNPQLHQQLLSCIKQLEQRQGNHIALEYISHEAFKALSHDSRAVVRTGECSPYANVILCSGVVF